MDQRGALRGLFVFNLGATIFFAWVAAATAFRGFVLWPVVILHAVITIALVPQIGNTDSVAETRGSLHGVYRGRV